MTRFDKIKEQKKALAYLFFSILFTFYLFKSGLRSWRQSGLGERNEINNHIINKEQLKNND